jgi:hypothetical protein
MFTGPPFSGAPHAALYLVAHQKNSVPPANALQLLQEFRRRGNISAFALNGLDKNRRHFLGIDKALENFTLQKCCRFNAGARRRIAVWAAVRIRIGNVKHASQERAESFALHGL